MNDQKALVFVVHGSRRQESNSAMDKLTLSLASELNEEYGEVRLAFLELCDPRVKPVVSQLAEEGIKSIDIFPYFLAPGNHVREDLPEIITELRQSFPDCQIKALPYLGDTAGWSSIVGDCIRKTTL